MIRTRSTAWHLNRTPCFPEAGKPRTYDSLIIDHSHASDPEYRVPVKKEQEAVPLVRSLLSELSASARASLKDVLPGMI